MKITKKQLKQIIREELKIAKTEKLNEALRVQQRHRHPALGLKGYEYVLYDTSHDNAISIGSAGAVQQLINILQDALEAPVESLPEHQ